LRRYKSYQIYVQNYLLAFYFNDSTAPDIYILSLHDALPISHKFAPALRQSHLPHSGVGTWISPHRIGCRCPGSRRQRARRSMWRSEEHTSELQSRGHLVCRPLLEKKKQSTPDFRDCTTKVYS